MMEEDTPSDLEGKMQRISRVTSLIGLGLMVFGFVDLGIRGNSLSIPGMAALSVPLIASGARIPPSLLAMSAGIIVLALLPILRVLLALSLYLRNRQVLNGMAALLVFIELVVSVRTGG
jgi:uncharacterized membrane protein